MAKLIFFGNERLANSVQESGVILQSLIDAGHEITNLVINRNERVSRKKHEDVVVTIAHSNGINVIDTWDEQHIIDLAKQNDAGVLASFGRIIKDPVISAFKSGIINIHPSLLPDLRGSTPIESAILGGLETTGVSVMALDSKLDAGNLYAQTEQKLSQRESKQELYESLAASGARLLVAELPHILDGSNTGEPQDHTKATFTKMIIKSDGLIDWDQPAEVIARQVRAFFGWPGSKATLGGHDITITECHTRDEAGVAGEYAVIDKAIVVSCGKGSIGITKLKPAGRGEMTTQAFLAGNQI